MQSTHARPAAPRPAATVVLLRPGPDGLEVLLTHRPASMAFAGDMHVFPGGAVDPSDGDPGDPRAFEVAAVRELFEEAGVLLAEPRGTPPNPVDVGVARQALLDMAHTIGEVAERLDVELRTDLLAPLSRWVTPPFVERRFDVRFFAAELPSGMEPSFVGDEVVADRWLTPRAALAAMAAGEIGLWVPTAVTLQQLEHVETFAQIRERLAPGTAAQIEVVEDSAGITRIVLPEAGAVPGQDVNAYLVGRRELVVVDPGDPSDAAADALMGIASMRGARIVGIMLTSAEPDHAAGTESLAGRLDAPVYAGPAAGHVLAVPIRPVHHGDDLPVGDIRLTVLESPGPRPDHVALIAPEEGAVLAGDLLGGGPSRAVVGPPDVPAWLVSLDRLANLAPSRLLPGHGDPPDDSSAAIEGMRAALLARGPDIRA